MNTSVVNIDKDIMGGIPVFFGTRVPIKNLFDYLESGDSIDIFLEDFESVSRGQVVKYSRCQKNLLKHPIYLIKVLLDECVTKKLKAYLKDF